MKAPLVLLTALFIASAHQTLSGETSGDWTYTVTDNQATITNYSGSATEIVVPTALEGIPVVKLGETWPPVFYKNDNSLPITKVTIPEGIKTIGDYAFYNNQLTEIIVPSSLTEIEDYAFWYNEELEKVTVSDTNPNYTDEDGILYNKSKTSLLRYPQGRSSTTFSIPATVTVVATYAFSGSIGLTEISIPNSVVSIGSDVFSNCSGLLGIDLPGSITSISAHTFVGCSSMTSITLPDSITSIGGEAFAWCSSLASVTIPNSVTTIHGSAFRGCDSLVNIKIPESVTYLGSDIFESSPNVANVTLPAAFFMEGNYSFYSLSAEQVRVEKTSIDTFVANAETAARASGARTIVNVSARVTLGSGQMVTPGFVVRDVPTKLLIRAVGPRLGDFGVNYLPNPRMKIFDGSQNVVRTIDDWRDDNPVSELSDLMTASASAGAFPLAQDTASAATLITLDPGAYTVQVDSADGGVGDVLVEVYEISE